MATASDGRITVEELIEFPTRFAFKAIGHHTRQFSQQALDAVRGAFQDGRQVELRTRLSRNGTYLSVTLTARLESADELRNVYAALRSLDGLITVL